MLEIRAVAPDDGAAIAAFYDIYVACGRHDAASFVAAPHTEVASVIRTPTEDFAYTAFLAYEDGQPIGEGWYAAYLRANLDKAFTTPRVLPQHRGKGVGSALLARMEGHGAAEGRTVFNASPRWPLTYGPEGVGAPSVEFARRRGFKLALVEAKRRLQLPVDPALLDELSAATTEGYRIVALAGPLPDELVQGWAELEASLPTEAPTGELDTEEFPPSIDSVRDDERVLAESGQVKYNAIALAPDGTAVGYTDIVAGAPGEPAQQWGTLVVRAHRGKGLGYGLKAAVIRLLQTERPDVPSTVTSNALTNTAMVAVNDRLGYEIVEYLGDVQKHLD